MPPQFDLSGSWESLLQRDKVLLERTLPIYLQGRSWFTGWNRQISNVTVIESLRLGDAPAEVMLTLARVEYTEGEPEMYALPIAFEKEQRASEIRSWYPHAVIALVRTPGHDSANGVLYDALVDPQRAAAVLESFEKGHRARGPAGEVVASAARSLRTAGTSLEPRALRSEHTSAAVVYGEQYLLKFFRRMGEGMSPELELGRILGEGAPEANLPRVVGAIEYRSGRGEP
ncbi:MAG: maltokinase N-terminal cap-like domain-containing protein, partial [Myxococcales bacterium]